MEFYSFSNEVFSVIINDQTGFTIYPKEGVVGRMRNEPEIRKALLGMCSRINGLEFQDQLRKMDLPRRTSDIVNYGMLIAALGHASIDAFHHSVDLQRVNDDASMAASTGLVH